jgi:threonine/homoserine/homoserine lactone efflux protein
MDPTLLVAFTLAFAVAAAAPGPGIAALVARSLAGGFAAALPMSAGLVLGDLVYLSLAVFGLAVAAAEMGAVFLVIRWVGALYLLYMAYRLWTAPAPEVGADPGVGGRLRPFLAGLSVTLGNPKVMVFYLALLPNLVDLRRVDLQAFAGLAGIVLVVLTAVMLAYAALADRARALIRSPRAARLVNRGAAAVMAGAAASIAAR